MLTNGKLKQERYWVYVYDKTGRYACLKDTKPHRMLVFISKEDGIAFEQAYYSIKAQRGHWVSRRELQTIIDMEYGGNYVLLDEWDILLLKSKAENTPLSDYDVPEG